MAGRHVFRSTRARTRRRRTLAEWLRVFVFRRPPYARGTR